MSRGRESLGLSAPQGKSQRAEDNVSIPGLYNYADATFEGQRKEDAAQAKEKVATTEPVPAPSMKAPQAGTSMSQSGSLAEPQGGTPNGEPGISGDQSTIAPKWEAYQGAMDDMWGMYNKSEGQWGDISNKIDSSEDEQKAQAQETGRLSQSRLDRQAAEMSALRGESVGGGSSQAGAAQANLMGRQQLQQQMTDISQWGSEAQMSNIRNMVSARDAMIGRMHSNAQQMASLASNAEESKKARDAMAQIEAARRETDILNSMISGGQIENPDEVMRLYYEGLDQGEP